MRGGNDLNLREFYREIFTENTFNSEKIKTNAIAGKYVKKHSLVRTVIPTAIIIALTISAFFIFTALNNSRKTKENGLSLIGKSISTLTPEERMERSRLLYEQQKADNRASSVRYLVSFDEPMTANNANSALLELNSQLDIQYFYIVSPEQEFYVQPDRYFKGYDGDSLEYVATGAVVFGSLDEYYKLSAADFIYMVEVLQDNDSIGDFKPNNPEYSYPTNSSKAEETTETTVFTDESTKAPDSTNPTDNPDLIYSIENDVPLKEIYFINDDTFYTIGDKISVFKLEGKSFVKIKELEKQSDLYILNSDEIFTYSFNKSSKKLVLNIFNTKTMQDKTHELSFSDSINLISIYYKADSNMIFAQAGNENSKKLYYAKIDFSQDSQSFTPIAQDYDYFIAANSTEVFLIKNNDGEKNSDILTYNISTKKVAEKKKLDNNVVSAKVNKYINFSAFTTVKTSYIFTNHAEELIVIDGNIDDIVYSADGKIAVIGGNAYYFNAGSVEIKSADSSFDIKHNSLSEKFKSVVEEDGSVIVLSR